MPQIVGTWPGPKIVIGKAGLPLDTWIVSQLGGDVIPSGASVAHMCMNIAALLGSDKLPLSGRTLLTERKVLPTAATRLGRNEIPTVQKFLKKIALRCPVRWAGACSPMEYG